LPTSFSWFPAAGIQGRCRAERMMLVKYDAQVASGASLMFA
jgi:hypothetical protein